LVWDVAVLDEHLFGVPVLLLAWQPVPALENQYAFARGSQVAGERTTSCPAADYDYVILIGHNITSSYGLRITSGIINLPYAASLPLTRHNRKEEMQQGPSSLSGGFPPPLPPYRR